MSTPQIFASESTRFYTRDGQTADEVKSADGSKMVKTTITPARKLGLLPGYSNIIKRLAMPQLEAWKIENALRVSLANPIQPGEDVDAYLRRVAGLAAELGDVTKDIGKALHAAIETFLISKTMPDDPVAQNAVTGLQRFMEIRGVKTIVPEMVFVDKVHGFAGRMDIKATECADGHPFIADVKTRTKGFGSDNGQPYYNEGVQLGAYWLGSGADPDCEIINILVDGVTGENRWFRWGDVWGKSKEPSFTKQVLADAFLHILAEWKIVNRYDPCKVTP